MSEISQKPPVPFKKIKSEDYDDGQVVMTIAGTITSLFPVKKGDTYEYQNGKMKDGEGTDIDVTFSKNTQPDTAKGKKVTIRSVKSEQHGWNGIKIEDQNYEKDGEKVSKRVLKITATADITYEGGASKGADKPSGGKPSQSPTPASELHPDTFIMDAVHFHNRCYHYAEQAYPDFAPSDGLPAVDNSALRQSCTASVFIEGCRNGMHVNFMERASKPVPPKILPPPKDPTLWKTCMIPKGEMIGKTLNDLSDDQLTVFYDAMKDKDTAFANCVKYGFEERGLLNAENPDPLDPDSDDIPF